MAIFGTAGFPAVGSAHTRCLGPWGPEAWDHCEGTTQWVDGNSFSGRYEAGRKTGQGMYNWPNGDKYIGDFKDGKIAGRGLLIWNNGTKYAGDMTPNNLNSQGTFIDAVGTIRTVKINDVIFDKILNLSVLDEGLIIKKVTVQKPKKLTPPIEVKMQSDAYVNAPTETVESKPSIPQLNMYLGAQIGSLPMPDKSKKVEESIENIDGGSASFTHSTDTRAGKLFLGWQPTKIASLELGYFASQAFDATTTISTTNYGSGNSSIKIKFRGWEGALVLKPFSNKNFHGLYGKIGATKFEANLNFSGSITDSLGATYSGSQSYDIDADYGKLVGVGYDYSLAHNWNIRTEATHYSKVAGVDELEMYYFGLGIFKDF